MHIQPTTTYNVSMNGKKSNSVKRFLKQVEQKAFDILPNADLNTKNNGNNLDKYTNMLSHPAINRGIMGVTALILQPYIDAKNHKVDNETKEVSVNRTIARTVIGTGVGICVRGLLYEIVKKHTNVNGNKRSDTILLPSKEINKLKFNLKKLNGYRSALSTIMALTVMLFTNFLIDAPLTKLLTNHFNNNNFSTKLFSKQMKEEKHE